MIALAWFGLSPSPFAPGPALAASCSNPSHRLTLTSGTVSPGTGTATTTFRFSVRYTDNANCAPTQVSVTVPGVGLFPLARSGTNYASGVTFSTSRRIPVGTWTYLFTAQSGSGGGARLVTFRSVSPSRVVVRAATATPVPTPKPTAKPTAKPTPKPTARPGGATPKPTAKPKPKPTPGTAGSPGATPAPTEPDGSTPDPGDGESPDPGAFGGTDDGDSSGGGGGLRVPNAFRGPAAAGFATWFLTTGGGILFFGFLMRRRRWEPQAVVAEVRAMVPLGTDADPTGAEGLMPRWRRPSVQAARTTSRYGQTISRPALKFATPAATGAERVTVQYRFVRVADSPDNIRSMELGRLDRGDEVDVVERRSGFAHVRAPDGLDGWVPRMAVAPIEKPD